MASLRLALVVALLAWPAPGQAQEATGRAGRVAAVQGEVAVLAGQEWRVLGAGATVRQGDRLATVGPSRALIQLDGGLTLTLGPVTEVELAEVTSGRPWTFVLDLVKGLARLVLQPPVGGAAATVSTPLAVTSVRSTEWLVEHGGAGTAVFVRSGAADVSAAGSSVELGPGQGTDIAAGGPPTAPRPWGEARIADALGRSTLGR